MLWCFDCSHEFEKPMALAVPECGDDECAECKLIHIDVCPICESERYDEITFEEDRTPEDFAPPAPGKGT